MYAIVKTGGKQYRVERGPDPAGRAPARRRRRDRRPAAAAYVDGDDVVDGDGLAEVTVQATIVAHERGPKLRIVKFKPKRGYKRRNGHRQELTRIEITSLGRSALAAPRLAAPSSTARR